MRTAVTGPAATPWILPASMFALVLTLLCCLPLQAQPSQESGTDAAAPAKPHKVSGSARHEAEHLYLEGAKAIQRDDLQTAQQDFAKASALNPRSLDYRTAEQIARTNLVTQLLQASDKAQILGNDLESQAKLQQAVALDPNNPAVLQHESLLGSSHASNETPNDTSSIQLAGSVALQPTTGLHSFHLHASGQQILQQVLSAYGITPTIDPSVKVTHTSFDADDVDYEHAARMVRLATGSFFVALDPKRVLVAKDTKENQDRFQREMLETVYLPGLTPEEAKSVGDMARVVFDAQQANVAANGTLTVRAPEGRLLALNHTLVGLLDGRAQVDVEVRLIAIDTSHTTNIGVQVPQQFSAFNVESEVQSIINNNQSLVQQIIANGLAPAGDLEAIVAVLIASGQVTSPLLNEAFGVFGNGLTLTGVTIPSVTANFALNSSETRMLEDVHLRLQDKDAGTITVGEKYPIETSSYSGLTSSSLSIPGVSTAGLSSELAALGLGGAAGGQQPIPQVQYQDIGLTLKLTPHILRSKDVTLDMELKLQALAGAALNNIPELTNRQFNATLTARDGQTTAFMSNLTKQESKAVSGVPGLSELPGFQSTTDTARQVSKSTLLILITPHVLRRAQTEVAGPAVLLPRHE
jgi:general secretion pathway protein D